MKNLGIAILIVGLLLGGYSLTMDVSVDVPSRDFGYGINTPAMKVANVDKMAQRQNFMVFSGILSVVGAILLGFGSMQPRPVAKNPTDRDIPESDPAKVSEEKPVQGSGSQSISICPKCRHMGDGDDTVCGRCGANLSA